MNTKANQEADDLFDEDAELEIEIVDDVAEDEKPRRAEPTNEADIPDEGDLENYSESVQKRIKKLTFEAKEARTRRGGEVREGRPRPEHKTAGPADARPVGRGRSGQRPGRDGVGQRKGRV